MQISIILPARNEAAWIGAVVGKIRSNVPRVEVILIGLISEQTAALNDKDSSQ